MKLFCDATLYNLRRSCTWHLGKSTNHLSCVQQSVRPPRVRNITDSCNLSRPWRAASLRYATQRLTPCTGLKVLGGYFFLTIGWSLVKDAVSPNLGKYTHSVLEINAYKLQHSQKGQQHMRHGCIIMLWRPQPMGEMLHRSACVQTWRQQLTSSKLM